jgi:hypothetical protein
MHILYLSFFVSYFFVYSISLKAASFLHISFLPLFPLIVFLRIPFLVVSYYDSHLLFYFFVLSPLFLFTILIKLLLFKVKQNFELFLPLKILISFRFDHLPKFNDSLHFETFFFLNYGFSLFCFPFFVKCIDVLKTSCCSR